MYVPRVARLRRLPVAAAAHDAVPPGAQRLRHAADPAARRRRRRHPRVRLDRRRRQPRRRPRRLPDPRRDPVRRDHERRRPRGRGRRPLHPRRDARQADGDRRRPQRRPDHRRGGARAPRGDLAARPTSTARWTAPRSSSRATRSPASSSSSINLLGGIAIGVLQQGMSFGEAVADLLVLTIGDGLAAQIPALLISTATGIIVTRAAQHDRPRQRDLRPAAAPAARADRSPAASICALALVPGLPKLPFLVVGGCVCAARPRVEGPHQGRAPSARPTRRCAEQEAAAGRRRSSSAPARSRSTRSSSRSATASCRSSTSAPAASCSRVGVVRRQIAAELGIVIGPVRHPRRRRARLPRVRRQGARRRGRARRGSSPATCSR